MPPIAGLQDICPTRSRFSVISPVSAPSRAAADAASQPACPAPITTTLKISSNDIALFANTERCENLRQNILRRRFTRDLSQVLQRVMQRHEHQLFTVPIAVRSLGQL